MPETDIVAGPKVVSIQQPESQGHAMLADPMRGPLTFIMSVAGALTSAPAYGSPSRDQWLVDFIHEEGNDLLAGAVSTVAAKIAATSWYVEGPEQLASIARQMLLHWSDFNRGWDSFILKWVQAYLTRDGGGNTELLRASKTNLTGPALGYAHLDESRCLLSGDPDYPIYYQTTTDKGYVKVHRSQVARIVDMPNPELRYNGNGWCAVSRALSTAATLMDIVKLKRQKISNLPPAGLLILQNLGPKQWDDITTQYDTRQRNMGNTIWQDLMVVYGVDPAYPTTAEFLEFADLGDWFNEKEATEVAIYSFALAFREDPREFWPVSSGPLGTATEAELQARKARRKGEGIIYTAIERQLNRPDALPPGVTMHFDYQDDDEDKMQAEIRDRKTLWIRRLWEASPNRQTGNLGQSEQIDMDAEPQQDTPVSGIITTEQAQQLLVREGVIPADILGLDVPVERLYDTRIAGTRRVRLYNDGYRVLL